MAKKWFTRLAASEIFVRHWDLQNSALVISSGEFTSPFVNSPG